MIPVPKVGDVLLRIMSGRNVILYQLQQYETYSPDERMWVVRPLVLGKPRPGFGLPFTYSEDFVRGRLVEGSFRLLSQYFALATNI